MGRHEPAIDGDGARVGRDGDEFGFALAEVLRAEHHPRVLQEGIVELVAREGRAGVFRNVARRLAEVTTGAAAGGDEVLLGEKPHRIGIGGGGEGFDFLDLDVVHRDPGVEAQVAQRDVVDLEVKALRVGRGFDEGAEARAVVGAGG